jgi:hypothetical protein
MAASASVCVGYTATTVLFLNIAKPFLPAALRYRISNTVRYRLCGGDMPTM